MYDARKHITDKIKQSYPFVDVVFGTHTLYRFPEDLFKALKTREKVKDVIDIDGEIFEGLPIKRDSNIKASVTIMNGCNNFVHIVLFHMYVEEKEVECLKT